MFRIVMFHGQNADHVRFCELRFRIEHKSTMNSVGIRIANYRRFKVTVVVVDLLSPKKCRNASNRSSYFLLKFLHLRPFIWYLKHHAVAATARKIWSIFIKVLIKMDNPVVIWGDSFSIPLSRVFPRVSKNNNISLF